MLLYENYNTGDDSFTHVYNWPLNSYDMWQGMAIWGTSTHYANYIKLKLYRVGSPGTVYLELRKGDATGLDATNPAGDLATSNINGNTLTTNTDGDWYTFTLSVPVLFTASLGFYIMLHLGTDIGDDNNKVCWRVDTTAVTGGIQSLTSGVTWQAGNWKGMFEVYSNQVSSDLITTGLRHISRPGSNRLEMTFGGAEAETELPSYKPTFVVPDYPTAPHVSGFTGTVNPLPGSPSPNIISYTVTPIAKPSFWNELMAAIARTFTSGW
jgi:hypothetical protein